MLKEISQSHIDKCHIFWNFGGRLGPQSKCGTTRMCHKGGGKKGKRRVKEGVSMIKVPHMHVL
jgi:hypothetical protein